MLCFRDAAVMSSCLFFPYVLYPVCVLPNEEAFRHNLGQGWGSFRGRPSRIVPLEGLISRCAIGSSRLNSHDISI